MTFEQKILRFSVVLIIFVAANTLMMTMLLKEQFDPLKLHRSWIKIDEELYPDEKVQITWAKTKIPCGQVITPDMVESGDVRYSRVEKFGRLPVSQEVLYSKSKRDLPSGAIVKTEDIEIDHVQQVRLQQEHNQPVINTPHPVLKTTAQTRTDKPAEEPVQGPVKPNTINPLPATPYSSGKDTKAKPPLEETKQVPQKQANKHSDKSRKRQS